MEPEGLDESMTGSSKLPSNTSGEVAEVGIGTGKFESNLLLSNGSGVPGYHRRSL